MKHHNKLTARTLADSFCARLVQAFFLFTCLFCSLWAYAETLTVSAASSLSDAMRVVAERYQRDHSDVQLRLNFAASGVLLQQIRKGAPVDIFITADQKTMNQAEQEGLLRTRQNIAGNTLVVVVPKTTEQPPYRRLEDLSQPSIRRIALGNPDSVPVGRYAQKALMAANLWDELTPRFIRTQNVRHSLDYVSRGEVDVGFVYRTDAVLANDKVTIAFTVPLHEAVIYPAAVLKNGSAQADDFLAFLSSDTAQDILYKFGFNKL